MVSQTDVGVHSIGYGKALIMQQKIQRLILRVGGLEVRLKLDDGNLSFWFVRSMRIDVAERFISQFAKPLWVDLLRHKVIIDRIVCAESTVYLAGGLERPWAVWRNTVIAPSADQGPSISSCWPCGRISRS